MTPRALALAAAALAPLAACCAHDCARARGAAGAPPAAPPTEAAAQPASAEVPVAAIHAGPHCGAPATGARWIGAPGELFTAISNPSMPGSPARAPEVDFAKDGAVVVSMGREPTAGYALVLAGERAQVADGVATVAVRFVGPGPGMVAATVVTTPCLVVRLPRAGLREVRIVDPTGAVRATAVVAP